MILYLAGNFTLLNNVNREREFKKSIEKRGKEYHRLVTFFYPKNVDTILQIAKEDELCRKESSKKTSSKQKRSRKG
mgnify:CR=1 FL=1